MRWVPGYAFVKGLAESMQQSQELATSSCPVWVRFDDCWQVGFETGRLPGGIVALYLASEPNPWSGSVVFMLAKRVTRLPMMIRALGIGSDALAAERELFKAQISEEQ